MNRGFFDEEQLHPYFKAHPYARSKFVGLVSCGKAKRCHRSKAKNLYTGTLTRMGIEWVERNCKEWYILSALHGLVPPDRSLDPYEQRLKKNDWEWAQAVNERLYMIREKRPLLIVAGSDYCDGLDLEKGDINVFSGDNKAGMFDRIKWLSANPVLTDKVLSQLKKQVDSYA